MAATSLREISLRRFALRRGEAAAVLGISPGTFDTWVRDGLMPKGKKIGGVVLWDADRVHARWQEIAEEREELSEDDGENPFDGLVA